MPENDKEKTTETTDLLVEKMNALEKRLDQEEQSNKELQDLNRKLLNSKGYVSTDGKTEKEKADIKAVQEWIDKGGK